MRARASSGRGLWCRSTRLWVSALLLLARAAFGQTLIEDNQSVASDSPEGWAMRYFAGTTLMTSFGEAARLAPWQWSAALEVGRIPHLSDVQQRVGFGGFKSEDLNKSPVFGRLRLALGLPDDWVAELGYTPPLELAGSQARNVFALAVGRRLVENDALSFSIRVGASPSSCCTCRSTCADRRSSRVLTIR